MFIDRKRELAKPEEQYSSDQAELFVLYGRRGHLGQTFEPSPLLLPSLLSRLWERRGPGCSRP